MRAALIHLFSKASYQVVAMQTSFASEHHRSIFTNERRLSRFGHYLIICYKNY